MTDRTPTVWTYEHGVLCADSQQFGKFAVSLEFGRLFELDQPLPQTLAKLKRMMRGGKCGPVSLDSNDGPYMSCSVQEGMLSLSFEFHRRHFWADLPYNTPAAQEILLDVIEAVKEGGCT